MMARQSEGACVALALAAGLVGAPTAAAQEQPWRLDAALDLPAWLTIEGETRVRYETLNGQFRAGGSGGDQLLAFRTLALIEADTGPIAFGVEIQDSRGSLDDSGTPLSTSIINPLDVLQAYVRVDLDNALGFERSSLTLGRQTLDIGSRRVIERVDMANVIFSYTGAHFHGVTTDGDELHLTAFSPTGRKPSDRASLGQDLMSGDEEEWGRRAWGVHWRERDFLGLTGVWGEAYIYGLHERDTDATPTPNRDYLQPGFRWLLSPRAGAFDFEIEAARRFGSRRQSSAASDVRDLDVDAAMLYAHAGYTFDHAWRPRVALDYYFSSGDGDPNDGRYEQFERLFGSRRSDLGNTGIHGPLTPANLNAPGFRLEIAPGERLDARLAYKAASLEEARDAWVVARLIDPSGQSGDFIGHAWDFRSRLWLVPANLRLEIGASALIPGGFADQAPNSPRPDRTLFGYVQVTQSF
jgi:hypothetical protein